MFKKKAKKCMKRNILQYKNKVEKLYEKSQNFAIINFQKNYPYLQEQSYNFICYRLRIYEIKDVNLLGKRLFTVLRKKETIKKEPL